LSIWVVAADSSRARFFHSPNRVGPLKEHETMVNSSARLHELDLVTDQPGRSFDSAGQGRHGMESPTSPKEEEILRFADEVVARLEQGRKDLHYDKLYILAPPAFLGHLRKKLSDPLRALVAGEIDKAVATEKAEKIRLHLPDFL